MSLEEPGEIDQTIVSPIPELVENPELLKNKLGNPNKGFGIEIIEQKSSSPQNNDKFEAPLTINHSKNFILATNNVDPKSTFEEKSINSITSNFFTSTRNMIEGKVKTAKILALSREN
jgi:hypothetical protein